MERWVMLRKGADFSGIAEKYQISPRLACLIRNRDVIGDEAISRYLNGTLGDLYDGMLMKDMDKAVAILREKIDGVNRREKFRLRYYGTDTSFIRLEKKYKTNGLCGKRSTRLTTEQVQKLLAGSYEFLLDSGNPLLMEYYSKLRGRGLSPRPHSIRWWRTTPPTGPLRRWT